MNVLRNFLVISGMLVLALLLLPNISIGINNSNSQIPSVIKENILIIDAFADFFTVFAILISAFALIIQGKNLSLQKKQIGLSSLNSELSESLAHQRFQLTEVQRALEFYPNFSQTIFKIYEAFTEHEKPPEWIQDQPYLDLIEIKIGDVQGIERPLEESRKYIALLNLQYGKSFQLLKSCNDDDLERIEPVHSFLLYAESVIPTDIENLRKMIVSEKFQLYLTQYYKSKTLPQYQGVAQRLMGLNNPCQIYSGFQRQIERLKLLNDIKVHP